MSDFKEVVKRMILDQSFRGDLLQDVDGTLKAHNYKISAGELSELKQLKESQLDELDERFANRLYSLGGTSLSGFTNLNTTVNLLGGSLFAPKIGGIGGLRNASGTW